jgi:hypothetical protein
VGTGSGSIEVVGGEAGAVEVHGVIQAHSGLFWGADASEKIRRIEENPPIEQVGDVVRVGRPAIQDEDLYDNVSISYRIVVPRETAVVSRTGSGSQTLAGVGDVQAKAGSGSIDIDGVSGSLNVKTGSGSIDARAIQGAIEASAGSGHIELEQTGEGDVSIHSSSGGVRISGVRGGLTVSTSSGSIRAQGEILRDWSLDASSGAITVELPPGASFVLDARTSSGNIESAHPLTVSGRLSRKSLRGTVGGGGPRLQLETSSGSIEVR